MPAGDRGVVSVPGRRPSSGRRSTSSPASPRKPARPVQRPLRGPGGAGDRPGTGRARGGEPGPAAAAAAPFGGTVLLEPLTEGENGAYPLTGPTRSWRSSVGSGGSGAGNLRLLADFYHLTRQRVRLGSGDRELPPGHRARADRRCPGPPPAGNRHHRVPGSSGAGGRRGTKAASGSSTARGSTEDSLGWLPRAAPGGERSRRRDHGRIHRARHHGPADVGQPGPGRLRRGRLQPPPERPPAPGRRRRHRRGQHRRGGAGADVVVRCCPTPPMCGRCHRRGRGTGQRPARTLVIDMSTIRPAGGGRGRAGADTRHARRRRAGIRRRGGRDRGALSIMVGGDADDFAGARPVLEAMGNTIVHVGSAGAGQTVKAANQLLVGGIIELVSEALLLVEAGRRGPAGGGAGARRRPGRQPRAGREGGRHAGANSSRASASTCTTRTWASRR